MPVEMIQGLLQSQDRRRIPPLALDNCLVVDTRLAIVGPIALPAGWELSTSPLLSHATEAQTASRITRTNCQDRIDGPPETEIRFPKPGNYINFTYVCKAKSDKLLSMKKPDRKESASFSYEDYCSWSEKERWEIIEGEAFNMTPAPGSLHQEISVNLTGLLWLFFRKRSVTPCWHLHQPGERLCRRLGTLGFWGSKKLWLN